MIRRAQGRASTVDRGGPGSGVARGRTAALRLRLLQWFVALWWLSVLPAAAVDRAGFETVRFQHLGVDEGLSQSSVRAIAQDRSGFIWLATQDGLNRYDGYEFRVFRRQSGDPASMPDNHVLALAADPDGGLWVGTQTGGLAYFDPLVESFESVEVGAISQGKLASPAITALLAHRWGGLWIATAGGPLQFLQQRGAALQAVPASGPAELGAVRALREGSDGSVLVATSKGIWRVSRPQDSPLLLSGGVAGGVDSHDVAAGFDGTLWVASDGQGLIHLDADGGLLARYGVSEGLPNPHLRALQFDRSGRLWIASLAGLARLELLSAQLDVWLGESASTSDGLSGSRVQSLFEDRDGLLWVGTWVAGANLHDPRSEAFVVARPSPSSPAALPGASVIDAVREDADSVWLVLHDVGQLVRLDLRSGVLDSVQPSDLLGRGSVVGQMRAMVRDRQGTLWFGLGQHGLGRRSADGRLDLIPAGPTSSWRLPEGEIYSLLIDQQQQLWVATLGGGLGRLCAGCREFEVFRNNPNDPQSLPGDHLNVVWQSKDGAIWVGMRFEGLVRLDPLSGRVERYQAAPDDPGALLHNSITALNEDAAGALWVGTQGGGVHRAERDSNGRIVRFERFQRNDGLAADAIGSIQFDSLGGVWVSTTAGLSRIEPDSRRIQNYGAREGAQASGYFIGSGLTLDDGRIMFGGLRGLTLFDPRDVQPPPPPLQVAISEVRVFGQSHSGAGSERLWVRSSDGGAGLQLAPGSDDFALDLSALTYASPSQILYQYRLDPLDADWLGTDARRRFAAYTNVPPGTYQFRARALRPGGLPSDELQLPIRISEQVTVLDWIKRLALPLSVLLVLTLLLVLRQRQAERARAQRRVQDSEARLKLALWGTGDELWDLDLRSRRMWRENALSYVRSSGREEVSDVRELTQYVHPDDRDRVAAAMGALRSGASDVLDVTSRVQHLDGSWVWLRSRGRIVERDANGRAVRLTGTTSDLTELKLHQQALEEINRDLEARVDERTQALSEANRDLEAAVVELRRAQGQLVEKEKMAALGGLVAGVAHEINTPLGIGVTAASHLDAATRQFLDKVRESRLTRSDLQTFADIAGESCDLILRNLHRADKLIKSFKQVAVDQSSEAKRRIDLAEYVEEVLTSLRPALRKSKHDVQSLIAPGIELDTYPGAIYQVLSNLVQNSMLHGFADRDGGGVMRLQARREGEDALIEYSDNGVGMPEEVRRRVFDPFFTTRRGSGGSGLGMHIVYNLVTQVLGGRISCESSPGCGVRIEIHLPLCSAAGQEGEAAQSG